MGFVIMAALFLPRLGRAHTPGLSVAEFEVQPDGRVDARITFANAEQLQGTSLNDADLRAFMLDGVDVTADGQRCPAIFHGASPAEGDGLVLASSYDCPRDVAAVEVTLYYLSALAPGHREVARIVARGASTEAVLTGDHRAISLRLPSSPAAQPVPAREVKGRRLIALSAVFAAFMLGLFVWRWRATRSPRR
jgi:hypothetical protein